MLIYPILGTPSIKDLGPMEAEKMAKITKLLLAGAKMLSVHCASCRSPLFQLRDRVTCPVCGEKVVAKAEPKPVSKELKTVLREKLDALTEELKREKDPRRISEILAAVKSVREALKTIEG